MKAILTIILAFILLGCGSDKMAHIGEEVLRSLSATNVTDDTPYYDTTRLSIAAHSGNNSFLIDDGELFSTGLNQNGSLGLGDTSQRTSFTSTGITDVRNVFAGEDFTFIIKEDGSLWGAGDRKRLGIGSTTAGNQTTFMDINITNVKTLSCSEQHSALIKTDGSLWITGFSGNGALGLGDVYSAEKFTDTEITNVRSVSTGQASTVIVKEDGKVFATGENTHIGLPSDVDVFTDTNERGALKVASGENFTLVLYIDNTVKGTGVNNYGQIGDGSTTNRTTYVSITSDVIDVACGNAHSAIVKSNGSLFTSGDNFYGELGLGDNTNVNVHTDTGSDVNGVACGAYHTIAQKTDNIAYSTGYNNNGQLGHGGTSNTNSLTTTGKSPDTFAIENWTPLYDQDIVRMGDSRYIAYLISENSPNIFANLTEIGIVNELKPFDDQNITPAISSSPMTYKITGTEEFNAFTLAKVLASSVSYTFKDSGGSPVKSATVDIDCTRDKDGILSKYPTTVVFYAGQQMEANSTVEITLTHDEDIELGDFPLNNMIDAGFTNLSFSHGIQDFNDYTPDPWGQIPESVKAIVTTFNISMDVLMTNYDYAVSFNESIAGKNVTIDASDSDGAVADGISIFGSLVRRVRVINPVSKTKVKDDEIERMATLLMEAEEIV